MNDENSAQSSAIARFRALDESGCFVLANPWDVGTAVYLQRLGFNSKKLNERVGRFLGPFLENPMAGVFQHDHRNIARDQLHLRGELVA
jgi:hypothetical protein